MIDLVGASIIFLSSLQPAPVVISGDPFKPLMIEPATTENAICRNGIVAHRIDDWKNPSRIDFGMSIEEIMQDVVARPIRDLEARGCDPRYLFGFMACTQVDDPNASPEIVRRGITAETDAEMAHLMQRCIDHIADQGVEPSLRQSRSSGQK